jgi:hypothetical protein
VQTLILTSKNQNSPSALAHTSLVGVPCLPPGQTTDQHTGASSVRAAVYIAMRIQSQFLKAKRKQILKLLKFKMCFFLDLIQILSKFVHIIEKKYYVM